MNTIYTKLQLDLMSRFQWCETQYCTVQYPNHSDSENTVFKLLAKFLSFNRH